MSYPRRRVSTKKNKKTMNPKYLITTTCQLLTLILAVEVALACSATPFQCQAECAASVPQVWPVPDTGGFVPSNRNTSFAVLTDCHIELLGKQGDDAVVVRMTYEQSAPGEECELVTAISTLDNISGTNRSIAGAMNRSGTSCVGVSVLPDPQPTIAASWTSTGEVVRYDTAGLPNAHNGLEAASESGVLAGSSGHAGGKPLIAIESTVGQPGTLRILLDESGDFRTINDTGDVFIGGSATEHFLYRITNFGQPGVSTVDDFNLEKTSLPVPSGGVVNEFVHLKVAMGDKYAAGDIFRNGYRRGIMYHTDVNSPDYGTIARVFDKQEDPSGMVTAGDSLNGHEVAFVQSLDVGQFGLPQIWVGGRSLLLGFQEDIVNKLNGIDLWEEHFIAVIDGVSAVRLQADGTMNVMASWNSGIGDFGTIILKLPPLSAPVYSCLDRYGWIVDKLDWAMTEIRYRHFWTFIDTYLRPTIKRWIPGCLDR